MPPFVADLEEPGRNDENKPPVYVKKRRIVQAARLAPKGFLETRADVDAFLATLRKELEAVVNNDGRVEIC